MQLKKAIVTLTLGKNYVAPWQKFCASNWHAYAARHGYDIICIDEPLDRSPRAGSRSLAWQKCLILGDKRVQKYDRVVWVDSDILINPNAPSLIPYVPEDKIGAVEMFGGALQEQLSSDGQTLIERAVQFWKWSFRTAKEFYARVGIDTDYDSVVMTGVMVLSPTHHRGILEQAYYEDRQTPNSHGEMERLSYEILKAHCAYWVDYKFHRLWIECALRDYPFVLWDANIPKGLMARAYRRLVGNYIRLFLNKQLVTYCVTTAFNNNYFLHFSGAAPYIRFVDTYFSSWSQLRGKTI